MDGRIPFRTEEYVASSKLVPFDEPEAHSRIVDCSSGACERNWSAHALVHTKRRNRLSTSQIERLIYCRENMRIMHKFENLTGPMQILLDRLDSKDWLTVTEALNHVRKLSIFHTSLLLQLLDNIVLLVVKAMKNPCSTVCKTSIMACSDLFKAYQDQMLGVLDPLLLQLLLKASHDKRFVCEEAEKALEGMGTWLSPMPLMQVLHPYINHRNPRIRAKAATCICRSVQKLGNDGMNLYGFDSLIKIAATQLNDQLPEAREAARKLLLCIYAAYCEQTSTATTTPESSPTDSKENAWKQFCCRHLSVSIAQAVLHLTNPSAGVS